MEPALVPSTNPAVEIFPVAWRPFDKLRLPLNEFEPVPLEKNCPAVLKPPAVTVLVAVRDFVMLREPANELDPALLPIINPEVVRLPVAWRPRFKFKLPEKELEPVPLEKN